MTPEQPSRENPLPLLFLYLGLASAGALLWVRSADVLYLSTWHADLLHGVGPAPNQYRPLTIWVAEAMRRLVANGDLTSAYVFVRALFTALALFCFDRYLRVWFSRPAAVAGALFLAAIIPFTYWRVLQESDPINLVIFVLAFWAIAVRRDAWLVPLVLVGTLNRETTAMIPALYLVVRWRRDPTGRVLGMALALAACWLLVYGGVRIGYGHRANYAEVVMLARNFTSLRPTVHAVLFYGAAWVLAASAWRDGPDMLRRALWLVPPFIALHYVVARPEEVRLFLPLAPIVIPLA
jgi:hypothetical protein